MAKKKKTTLEFTTVIVLLAIAFACVLFIVKMFSGSISWLDVFAPLLVAFLLIFLHAVLKTIIKKI